VVKSTKNHFAMAAGKMGLRSHAFLRDRRSGLLFSNRSGKPLSQTNVARRSLHPILEELKVEKTGFHAMRRFRTAWLRKQRAPEDIIKFWLGHAKESVTDTYSKLADDGHFRKQVAETLGTGFEVPSVLRPMKPKKSKRNDWRLQRELGNLCGLEWCARGDSNSRPSGS